ncbi:MAG TPA: hypothetical protein ENH82_17500 [bacterium]|nr:hypothetical protein [bacterium]
MLANINKLELRCGYFVLVLDDNKYKLANLKSGLSITLNYNNIMPWIKTFGTDEDIAFLKNHKSIVTGSPCPHYCLS